MHLTTMQDINLASNWIQEIPRDFLFSNMAMYVLLPLRVVYQLIEYDSVAARMMRVLLALPERTPALSPCVASRW